MKKNNQKYKTRAVRNRPPAENLQWKLNDSFPEESALLAEKTNIPSSVANILIQRGISEPKVAQKFLNPEWHHLHDPFKMKGMSKVIDRLVEALHKDEKVLLYGDYDVDGTTAIAMVHSIFQRYYKHLDCYVPNRFKEGYGFSKAGVDYAKDNEVGLILTLDCGITSVESVAYANSKGIDVIICDHHLPGEETPDAFVILDPHQEGCEYPFKGLSGAGVAFKMLQAFSLSQNLPEEEVRKCLDLLVISTACDIVPMLGENRVLSYFGLKYLEETTRPGVVALLKIARQQFPVQIRDLVFGVGPLINAAGRMGDALLAVRLLLAETDQEASDYGAALMTKNKMRRRADQKTEQAASTWFESLPDHHLRRSIVAYQPYWHQGVIGIVAARLAEHYRRPTVILTRSEDGLLVGSARSVHGYDLYKGLVSCEECIDNFGGHQHAAGLKMNAENLDSFRKKFENWAKQQSLHTSRKPILEISEELDLESITDEFYEVLKKLAPFGPHYRTPVFIARNVYDSGESRLVKGQHLFLSVNQGKAVMPAVGFSMSNHWKDWRAGKPFDICFKVEQTSYRGRSFLRLHLKDMKLSEENEV